MNNNYGPSFALSDEHQMILQAARDFAQKEIAPIASEFDETGDFPYETIKKMGSELDRLHLCFFGINPSKGRFF